LELEHGWHILLWSFAMIGGMVAGAQVTCILLLPSMFAWTCYHYSAGAMPHAVLNLALTASLAYLSCVPWPGMQPVEWTPAAIFLTMLAVITALHSLPGLVGGKMMEAEHAKRPYLKDKFWDDEGLLSDVDCGENAKSYKRARELALSSQLLGAGCCMAAAAISGGAQYTCLLVALPVIMNGYCHWLRREQDKEQKFGAIFSWVIAAALISFSITG